MLYKDTIVTLCVDKSGNRYSHEKIDQNSPQICLYDALHYIANENKYALHDLIFHNIPVRDRLREVGLRQLLDEFMCLYSPWNMRNILDEFYRKTGDVKLAAFDIQLYRVDEVVKIWGQEIGNLETISQNTEIFIDRGGPFRIIDFADWGYHVGQAEEPYPCFDSEDWANEDRHYQNYIIRKDYIIDEEMERFYCVDTNGNACRVHEETPEEMLPMIYYKGDGDFMLVATKKNS